MSEAEGNKIAKKGSLIKKIYTFSSHKNKLKLQIYMYKY